MPPPVPEAVARLRRTVAWSNSRQSWRERLGLLAWLLAALAWYRWLARDGFVLGPLHLAAAAGLVLALAVLARRGWVRLFGPVLFYEVIRSARRGRYFLLRWLYAVGLLLLLLWVHSMWSLEASYRAAKGAADPGMQARLAEEFFYAFAFTQFAVIVVLTPSYVAGAVAEEKERRTLEFLLATDLRGREIVLGKLLARAGNLALFLLTGLPVLSLMQFFGGIDPGLLLVSFALTGLTAASLAGLGILNSVLRRKARDAIVLTYLVALGYVVLASLSLILPPLVAEYRTAAKLPPADWQNALERAVSVFNYGNPINGLIDVGKTVASGIPLADTLLDVTGQYALFHGSVALACVAWAVVRLRPVALAQAGSVAKPRKFLHRTPKRPPVGARPMVWKEVRIEGGLRFGWFGRIVVALLVGVSFIPVVVMVYFRFFDMSNHFVYSRHLWDDFGKDVNNWLRTMNVIISMLMLLGVAVRAAGAIGGERDRDTLVSLMTTSLSTREILLAKWLGSVLSVRLFLWWLGAVWAIGLVTGAVAPPAVVLQVLAWLAPASFVGALGLYCSAACRTTLRATTWALVGTLFACGFHWLCVGMCFYAPLAIVGEGGMDLSWTVYFELAMTPPVVFWWVPCHELSELRSGVDDRFPALAVLGMFLWCVAAAAVGHFAHERFRRLTHRDEWERGAEPKVLPPVGQT